MDELARDRRPVKIQDNTWDAVHVQAQGITEEKDHEKGIEESAHEAPDVPAHLNEFLLGERLDSSDAHDDCPALCPTRATNTSSRVGSMGRIEFTRRPDELRKAGR